MAFNQFAALTFQYRFNKLVMKLDSSYSIVKGSNREVNTITTTQTFWNSLAFATTTVRRPVSILRLLKRLHLPKISRTPASIEGRAGMNYQILPKTRVGFQGVAGVIDSTDTPLQYFQQVLMQSVRISATGQAELSVQGGLQFLEFEGSDVVKIDPVFSLGVDYQPFPQPP